MSNAAAFEKLRRLRMELKRLPQTNASIASKAAPAITGLARGSWAAGMSVYGDPYPPNKDGSARTLNRTGALGAQIRFEPIGTGIKCVLGVPYARFRIKDGILPRGGSALPVQWKATLTRISNTELTARLGRV